MVLLILMPTGGQVVTATVHTLVGLTQELASRKLPFSLKTYEWSDLVVSRNYLLSYFLKQSRFTHALLLDSDLSFEPELVLRMIALGEDFVVAPYPNRRLPLDRLRDAVLHAAAEQGRPPEDMARVMARALRYNLQREAAPGTRWQGRARDGFFTVPAAATGCMLLARAVPEKMVEAGVARAYPRFNTLAQYRDADFHDFFSHLPDAAGTYLQAEDQSFCARWVKGCGGEIWAAEEARITHHGSFPFYGDFAHSVG